MPDLRICGHLHGGICHRNTYTPVACPVCGGYGCADCYEED